MSKKIVFIVILIIIAVGAGCWIYRSKKEAGQPSGIFTLDARNCIYTIEGKSVALKDGYSEEEIVSGSASKLVTRYFGNEVSSDFNGDGFSDIAFLLTQDSGGSGTFYYAAAALGSNDKCNGTNAVLLGDRIAPQTTEFKDGEIIVNYAERKSDDPMTTAPSVGVSKYLKVNGRELIEIQK
jgi:hypothetical protein